MNEQIILLNDYMPAGFFRCCADKDRSLDMVNHELLSLFGCADTKELEELTGGTLKGMVDARDYTRVLDEVLVWGRKSLRPSSGSALRTEVSVGWTAAAALWRTKGAANGSMP